MSSVLRLSQDRTRAKVVARLFEKCRETGRKFVIATTGGGGGLAKWILGTPGASACLLEYRVSIPSVFQSAILSSQW